MRTIRVTVCGKTPSTVSGSATNITMFRRGTHHPQYLTEPLYVSATLMYLPILRNV
jgi:hypothetical protein